MKRLNLLVILIGMALSAGQSGAQTDDSERPRFSEPLSAENALDAFTQAAELGEAAEAELQQRFLEDQDRSEPLKRVDPILYAADWPHDACNSIETLLPPPLEGWGIRALNNLGAIPITELNADVAYYAYAADQEPGSFPTASVSIRMSRNQADVEGMEVFLSQEAMRDVMFTEGPYGYPVIKLQTGALIGDVLVYVTGTDQTAADAYLAAMVGCAVGSGFLAKGVDPETLRDEP